MQSYVLHFLVLAIAQATPSATYDITITTEPLRASVEAEFALTEHRLLMARGGGIDHLPGQWTTFVEDLAVTRPNGDRVPVERNGAEGWRLPPGTSGHLRVRYTVDLRYATEPWPPGNEQAGLWLDGKLYTVTKPLFVTAGDGSALVRFHLPSGWKAATPWEPAGAPNAFLSRGGAELTENSLVLGPDVGIELTEGEFTLVLGLVGPDPDAADLLASTFRAALRHAVGVFDRTPPGRFMMSILYTGQDDGEGFETSGAIATATVPREANRQLWGNNLAHELYHIWIGGRLAGSDDTFEWFDEGFTDYYADKALVQNGLIDHNQFRTKMEKVMGRYGYFVSSPIFGRMSLAEASRNKGRNRFGVYDGGWAAAFCLDVTIRRHSGLHTLDDAMRILHDRFALADEPFNLADMIAVVSEVAGVNLAPFFEDHVVGNRPLPLEECLAGAGLEGAFQQYAAELWISEDPDAGALDKAVFESILTGGR